MRMFRVPFLVLAGLAAASGAVVTTNAITPNAKGAQRFPEDFVYLRLAAPSIQQDIRYATINNFTGGFAIREADKTPVPGYLAGECVVRKPVACALKRVQDEMRTKGFSLKVYDCYRPQKAVDAFKKWAEDPHAEDLKSQYYPRLTKDQLIPLDYINLRSGHSKGASIDLTIVPLGSVQPEIGEQKNYGACNDPRIDHRIPDNSVNMGAGFDCFDEISHTQTPAVSAVARQRRKVLVDTMRRHGFKNYPKEWWHFGFSGAGGTVFHNFDILPPSPVNSQSETGSTELIDCPNR